MQMPRIAGGHEEQMHGLFRGGEVLAFYHSNDYQGTVASCIRLPDGRVVIFNDYYGSCSGCDAWEDATDDEVRVLCINLANSAYIFENLEEALAWMEINYNREDIDYRWVQNNCLTQLYYGVMDHCGRMTDIEPDGNSGINADPFRPITPECR